MLLARKIYFSSFAFSMNNLYPYNMKNGIIEILLIDDDPDDAELTVHTLKKNHIANHLLYLDDGERALEFLYSDSSPTPKLILLDLRMPRVDGIHILRKLKSDPKRKDIPVVVLISSREGKNYVESHDIKADAYIVKPVDFKKFLTAISEIGLSWKILDSPMVGDAS
jgi:two-component system, response regulator